MNIESIDYSVDEKKKKVKDILLIVSAVAGGFFLGYMTGKIDGLEAGTVRVNFDSQKIHDVL